MNHRILAYIISTIICFSTCFLQAKAQTIVLNESQDLAISGPGFFPSSNISNDQFINTFPTNPIINCEFMGFSAGPLTIAPAMDFSEIGSTINITGNTNVDLDFGGASSTMGTFGISLVPLSGPSVFTINCMIPEISTSSSTSSSSGSIIGEGFLNPNALTVFSNFVPDNLVDSISNNDDNPQCSSDPSGINGNALINLAPEAILDTSAFATVPRIVRYLSSNKDSNTFTLLQTTPKQSKTVYNQVLRNTTDKTKIFVTGLLPSVADTGLVSRVNDGQNFTPLNQSADLVALAAVQHTLVSATMPWQLGGPNSAFIVQGGGCVGPFCTIVEQGMITVIPGGACTPEKLNRRKMNLSLVNPSKLFDPFPASQSVIQVPSSSVVNPNHPNVSTRVNSQNGYLIFQPVPPNSTLKQQLKIAIQQPCQTPVACDKLCSNIGACCKADKSGNAAKVCTQTGQRCSCK